MKDLTLRVPAAGSSRVPLLLEVPVSQGLDGPFLVSGSKGMIWVSDKFPSGVVRAAVRKAPLEFLYREAVQAVAELSEEAEWGSVAAPTKEGVGSILAHLEEYGFDEVVLLVQSEEEHDESIFPDGIELQAVPWVPRGWVVALPRDVSYVGTAFEFGKGQVAMVLHNPSRGIGIAIP